jgi:hypothetical protein
MILKTVCTYITAETSLAQGSVLHWAGFPPDADDTDVTGPESAILESSILASPDFYDQWQYRIRVHSRGLDLHAVHAQAWVIHDALHYRPGISLPEVTDDGGPFLANMITAESSPQFISRDDKERALYSAVYLFHIQKET